MMTVTVTGGVISEAEKQAYVQRARQIYAANPPYAMTIHVDGDFVDMEYHFHKPFDRIRRITGYLVGTTDRFNNAKRAEERDRVKHTIAAG